MGSSVLGRSVMECSIGNDKKGAIAPKTGHNHFSVPRLLTHFLLDEVTTPHEIFRRYRRPDFPAPRHHLAGAPAYLYGDFPPPN